MAVVVQVVHGHIIEWTAVVVVRSGMGVVVRRTYMVVVVLVGHAGDLEALLVVS